MVSILVIGNKSLNGPSKMIKSRLYLIFTVFILMLCGCASKVTDEELIGSYEAKYPKETANPTSGVERLELKVDKTYYQEFEFDEPKKIIKNSGKWEYIPEESRVKFTNVLEIEGLSKQVQVIKLDSSKSYWTAHLRKYGDRIRLDIDEDRSIYFKKNKRTQE